MFCTCFLLDRLSLRQMGNWEETTRRAASQILLLQHQQKWKWWMRLSMFIMYLCSCSIKGTFYQNIIFTHWRDLSVAWLHYLCKSRVSRPLSPQVSHIPGMCASFQNWQSEGFSASGGRGAISPPTPVICAPYFFTIWYILCNTPIKK